MQPTWQSPCKRAQLWLGDCRDIPIPKEATVISDPPYNVGKPQLIQGFIDKKTGRSKMKHGSDTVGQNFGKDFDEDAIEPAAWVKFMPDTVACFYGAKRMRILLKAFHLGGFEVVQDFHWCKKGAPPPLRGVGFAWAVESGYLFRRKGTKHRVNKSAGFGANFYLSPICHTTSKQIHTTQKPITVMKWLVHFLTEKESLVADHFMGSGGTGVAAIQLGRRFMGIEKKPEYFDLAVSRLKKALQKYQGSFQL